MHLRSVSVSVSLPHKTPAVDRSAPPPAVHSQDKRIVDPMTWPRLWLTSVWYRPNASLSY